MIAHAIIWSVLSTASAVEPQAFANALRLAGIESTFARRIGTELLVVPSTEHPSAREVAAIRAFISNGGDAILAGEPMIRVFEPNLLNACATVKDVTEIAHPERYLRWNPPWPVPRFSAPTGAMVLLQDQPTHQPLAFYGRLGKGRYLAFATAFDQTSKLGVTRYPYFAEYLRAAFDYHPRVVRPAIEAYFDPGFRQDADLPALVAGWRKAGISKIYAATWYKVDYSRLIDLCHAKGIAVYAWFTLPMVGIDFWNEHPKWQTVRTGWRYPINMGIPEAREAAFERVRRDIERFQWDGINFAEMNSDSPADAAEYTALHREVLQRFQYPGLEIIVTALDSIHSPRLKSAIGIDTNAIAALRKETPFTLQLEDAFEFWPSPPDRYVRFAQAYAKHSPIFDVNIVADRDIAGSNVPSALATGTEFLQLLHFASQPTGRLALYSESTVAPNDWEFASAALAADAHVAPEGDAARVRSPHPVSVKVSGGWALVPAGNHLVKAPTNLQALSCDLLAISETGFEYSSPGRCAYAFAKPPAAIAVDGASWTEPTLPRGHHQVSTAAPEWRFTTSRSGEVGLTIHAAVPGTNWAKPKAEAAIITLTIDGKYNQDVTLYMGATPHDYRVLLGPLAAGSHRLEYSLNPAGVQASVKASFQAEVVNDDALAQAPVMYLRPDTVGRFSDLPLHAWYEWLDEPGGRVLQFSMIFSNEDGGTDTAALMARWGRTLDIEYVVRFQGKTITFQARNHKETPFAGTWFARHPVVYDVSDNNNFGDAPSGEAPLRVILWPEPFDLSRHSREELADRNPWTYRIMYEELLREGKVEKIGDPREYLYVEARIEAATAAASFIAGGVSSDGGVPRQRIDRDGWVRSAIRVANRDPRQIEFRCDLPLRAKPQSFCVIGGISKLYFLDQDFRPQPTLFEWPGPAIRLAPGEGHIFQWKGAPQTP